MQIPVHLTESAYGAGVQDPLSYLQGSMGGADCYSVGYSSLQDYADGDFRPFWFNLLMHGAHRSDCRLVNHAIALSYNIAETLENYVIGQGYTYTAKSRSKVPGTDSALVAAVQRDLDRINSDNSFSEVDFSEAGHECGSLESQIHNRSRVDGEDFVAIFSPRRGEIEMRLVGSEHITEGHGYHKDFENKLGYKFAQSWKYGVHTGDHDIQKALGYVVQWDVAGSDIEYFPAMSWEQAVRFRTGLMHHIKRNVNVKVKRGMSDYFPVATSIVDDAKLVRNMVRGAQAQAAIAWIEQHLNAASASRVANEVSRTKGTRKTNRQVVNESRSDYRRSIAPGTVLHIDKGKEFRPGPMGADRNNGFGLVAELSIRRIGLRWHMPEYMISSDASNGNRASTEVAEGPFEKARIKDQSYYCGQFRMIHWKALSILVAQGYYRKFGVHTFRDLLYRIGINVDAPNVSSRDQLKAAQANEILHNHGVLTKKTWQVQAELDPDQEDANETPNVPVEGSPAVTPGEPASSAPEAGSSPEASSTIQLNGAQITAANDILTSVTAGTTTQFVAKQLLVSLGLPANTAAEMAKSAESSRSLPEEDVQRIARQVQKTLWEEISTKAKSYP